MLAWLTKLLENKSPPIDTILHIGAGVGTELPVYQGLNCKRIIAIEPDPTLFKKLQAKAKRFDNVEVQQKWISENTGERNASVFTNPRFNSLLSADKKLLDYFPNVSNPKTLKVKTKSFNELFKENINVTDNILNILILEVQGIEIQLLNNCSLDTFHGFDWIVIRTSAQALYKNGAMASEISECLLKMAYELRLSDNCNEPFTEYYYELNRSKLIEDQQLSQIQQLNENLLDTKSKVDSFSHQLKTSTECVKSSDKELVKVKKQLVVKSEKVHKLELQLQDNNKNLTALKRKYKSIESKNQKITNELKSFSLSDVNNNKKIVEMQARCKQLEAEISSSKAQLDQKIDFLSTKEATLASVQKANDDKDIDLQALKESLKEVNRQLSTTKTDLIDIQTREKTIKDRLVSADLENKQQIQDQEKQLNGVKEKLDQQTNWHHENKHYAESLKANVNSLENTNKQLKDELTKYQENSEVKISDLSKQKEQLAKNNQDNKNWIASLKKEIEILNSEVRAKSKTADLGQMMLAKATVDLDNLREAYSKKLKSETALADLVKELRQKLVQASKYYFQLQQEYPELIKASDNKEND